MPRRLEQHVSHEGYVPHHLLTGTARDRGLACTSQHRCPPSFEVRSQESRERAYAPGRDVQGAPRADAWICKAPRGERRLQARPADTNRILAWLRDMEALRRALMAAA